MPDFTSSDWLWALVAAMFCGVGKAGLAGLGMLNVLIMARIIPGTASSGVVLPMLIAADILACAIFGTKNVDWKVVTRLIGPMIIGILIGWRVLALLEGSRSQAFERLVGTMILVMVAVQVVRQRVPAFDRSLPHSRLFGWGVGLLAGLATMIANAAGPIGTIYFLILGFAKKEFIATMAWLFLVVNVLKVPFSAEQGLITGATLRFNALLLPAIVAGFFLGRWAIARIPQRPFEQVVLALTVLAALRLVW